MTEKATKKQFIRIRGANVNNLKNLSVDIPRDQFVVLTGVSGSGKFHGIVCSACDFPAPVHDFAVFQFPIGIGQGGCKEGCGEGGQCEYEFRFHVV